MWQALRSGAIDAYPEYTGTIAEVILKRTDRPSLDTLRAGLAPLGIAVGPPLGFNDGYGTAVARRSLRGSRCGRSDLAQHPECVGMTHEFSAAPTAARARARVRPGAEGRARHPARARVGRVRRARSTRPTSTRPTQIAALSTSCARRRPRVLPALDAVVLYRARLDPQVVAAWDGLAGRIDEARWCRQPRGRARAPVRRGGGLAAARSATAGRAGRAKGPWANIARRTGEHLKLVGVALLLSILLGVPLGIVATRSRLLAKLALGAAGLVQTVPSLALLAFLIPLVGIGTGPALIALFVYGLLPIVRNTYVGLTTLPRPLVEAAEAMGLSQRARLTKVALPLASQSILAGIQTSAVITVGTATIAALIGAGGLGEPILSGIQLRDRG